MSQIGQLLESAGRFNNEMRARSAGLVKKWERFGLLEGLQSEYDRATVSILLENQAKQLLSEHSSTGTTPQSEQWSGVALPLVRRIFSEIAAKDFVSVQPMNIPSGLVFYLDFKYGDDGDGGQFLSGADVWGNTSSSADPTGGLYGAGKFGYSIKDQTATIAGATQATVATASHREIGFDTRYSSSIEGAGANLYKVTFPITGLTRFDKNSVRALFITSSGVSAADNYSEFNFLVDANGNEIQVTDVISDTRAVSASVFVSASSAEKDVITGSSFAVFYHQQPTDQYRGDFEDTIGTGNSSTIDIEIPEIDVELRSEQIVAKTRKLKAVWSQEFAQDLNAYHSIDAEAELTSMLSEHVSMEIDLEIVAMLLQNAITEDYWSVTIGETIAASGQVFTNATGAEAYQQGTWFQTLGTKLQKVSNKIHAKTLRGGANFMVVSPEVATIIESIPGFAAVTDGTAMGTDSFQFGIQKVGAINNRFTVYKNPYKQTNEILLGYRGSQFLETGAVYAPYIPLIMTPLVYDPTNFTPRKGVMTRYAKKVVRPEFYGRVFVKDLHKL